MCSRFFRIDLTFLQFQLISYLLDGKHGIGRQVNFVACVFFYHGLVLTPASLFYGLRASIVVMNANHDVIFPQTIVAIAGKESRVRLVNASTAKIDIKQCPGCVEALHLFADGNDLVLTLLGKSYHPEPETMAFTIDDAEQSREVEIPVRTLTDKEFFVVFCLQSNYHHGWDPANLAYSYDVDKPNEPVCKAYPGKVGQDEFGSSYSYLYDDSDAMQYNVQFTPVERILHEKNIPITWAIDNLVAGKMASMIASWHLKHGDTYAALPTSYFYTNSVNYNLKIGHGDAKKLLQETLDDVLDEFKQVGYPMYANVACIDPWVGSIGTNFVKAALDLNLKGLCGMGWDHDQHGSSMYHRGAPWDAYKPSKIQFRIPARENERFELFLFQTLTRDLANSLHLSPQGSRIFSTSAQCLRMSGIMAQDKPNYLLDLFYNYFKNMKYNDYFVFIITLDDHDAVNEEDNQYMKKFVEGIVDENPPGIVLATLEEVAQWLAIKYPDNEVPSQLLEIEDSLVPSTRAQVLGTLEENVRQVYDPINKAEFDRVIKEHFPEKSLPTHLCFFDRSMLFITYPPHRLPVQMWDYRRREEWGTAEDGQFPLAILPKITIIEETMQDGYKARLISNKFFSGLPWIVWSPPFVIKTSTSKSLAIQSEHAVVFFMNVQAGENNIDFSEIIE